MGPVNLGTPRRSLTLSVVASIVLVEFVFALVLGITVGTFWALEAARSQQRATEQITATVAAALMPMIADQQGSQVAAQMHSILEASGLKSIQAIRIVDSSGDVIAEAGDVEALDDTETPPRNPWSTLLDSRTVREPITVGTLTAAYALVRFSPPVIWDSVSVPLLASAVVLIATALVSAPWTALIVSRRLVQPLVDLERVATRVADGEYDIAVSRDGAGEVGRLQETVARMAVQIAERRAEVHRSRARLEEAYRSLEEAKTRIEQLAAVKEDFVAVAAHEIRTPLTTIRLYAEMLDTGELGRLDPRGTEAAAAILSASRRLESIVSDLMDAALLERGELQMRMHEIRLDQLLADAVKDADAHGRTRGIRVRLQPESPGEAHVSGDPVRLRQVVDNLLSNALKYSPEGSEVVVRLSRTNRHVKAEFMDRGRGISESDTGRLFTLFGRLDLGDSREAAGLGLGLAISARIIEAHGGTITVKANTGRRGSIFTVTLPVTGSGPADDGPSTVNVVRGKGSA